MAPDDEHFHSLISDFLHTWAMKHSESFVVAQVVGEQWSPRCHEMLSNYLIREIEGSENIEVRVNSKIVDGGGDYRLEWVVLQNKATGKVETVEASGLFVLIGAVPNTNWLPAEIKRTGPGYIVTGQDLVLDGQLPEQWPLSRPPLLLETSIPRVFACGDVRHRSIKRVASAVGDGSIAVQLIHQALSE